MRLVLWLTVMGVCFGLGMVAGEQSSAADLKPCPGSPVSTFTTEDGQFCQYAAPAKSKKLCWRTEKL